MFLVDPGGAQVQELVELQSFAHLGYGKSKVVAAVAWRPQVEGEVKKKRMGSTPASDDSHSQGSTHNLCKLLTDVYALTFPPY